MATGDVEAATEVQLKICRDGKVQKVAIQLAPGPWLGHRALGALVWRPVPGVAVCRLRTLSAPLNRPSSHMPFECTDQHLRWQYPVRAGCAHEKLLGINSGHEMVGLLAPVADSACVTHERKVLQSPSSLH